MSRTGTTHLFSKQKEDKRKPLTHEQIATDLDVFARSGGMIEVLGNTSTLRTIPLSATQPASTSGNGQVRKKGKTTQSGD